MSGPNLWTPALFSRLKTGRGMPASFAPEPDALTRRPSLTKNKRAGSPTSPNRRATTRKDRKLQRAKTLQDKELLRERHAGIRKHVEIVRAQLKKREQGKHHVLKPGDTRWLAYWDVVSACALMYTATLTPFEVAFLSPAEGAAAAWSEPWFLINRGLDVIFSFDICLQFFLAYHAEDPETGSEVLVEQHSKIVKHYVTTWFPIDAFTVVVPSTFDIIMAHTTGPDAPEGESVLGGADSLAANASMLRVLRILRLFKLVRLARASRIIKRWRAKITLNNGTLVILQCIFELVIATHWYACFFSLQAGMAPSIDMTWLGESMLGYCDNAVAAKALNMTSPASTYLKPLSELDALEGCPGLGVGSWYLAACSWSIMVITGTGGTGYWPSSRNDIETGIVTLLVIIGAFLWTTVLARFCEVATNSNPGLTHFLQSLDEINQYTRINKLPTELGTRLREYMHEQRLVQQKLWAEKALPQLSAKLQVECILHSHRAWLDAIWFVKGFGKNCKVKLAQSMSAKVLTPGEVAPLRHMYVIGGRGLVMYGMKVLHKGNVWGDDVILQDEKHFSPYTARAMSYVEVSAIHRDKLLEVVSAFPASYQVLRRSNILLAMRRHIITTAHEKKKADGQIQAEAGDDFVSTVHKAAQELDTDEQPEDGLVAAAPDIAKIFQKLELEISHLRQELREHGVQREQRKQASDAPEQPMRVVQAAEDTGGGSGIGQALRGWLPSPMTSSSRDAVEARDNLASETLRLQLDTMILSQETIMRDLSKQGAKTIHVEKQNAQAAEMQVIRSMLQKLESGQQSMRQELLSQRKDVNALVNALSLKLMA